MKIRLHISKFCLLLLFLSFSFVYYGQISPEKYLDSLYKQQIKLSDSLCIVGLNKASREILDGHFLKPYLAKLSLEEKSFYKNRKCMMDSLTNPSKDPYEQLFLETKYIAAVACKKGNYVSAIKYWSNINHPKEQQERAWKEIEKIVQNQPLDTLCSDDWMPVQSYIKFRGWWGGIGKSEYGYLAPDTSRIYLRKNDIPFSGIWIRKEFLYPRYKPSSYTLHYKKYVDGYFIQETKTETYNLKSFYFLCSNLNYDLYCDKSNYYLRRWNYTKNDTIMEISYFENGEINGIEKRLSKGNNLSYYYKIQHNENGTISEFAESKRENGKSDGINFKLNKNGDTLEIDRSKWIEAENYDFNSHLEFDDLGDTIDYHEYNNGKLNGLQVKRCNQDFQNKTSKVKILWQDGQVIDILTPNIIFTDGSGNLLSKNEFIKMDNETPGIGSTAYQISLDSEETPEKEKKYYMLLILYEPDKYIKDKKKVVEKWLKQNSKKQKKTLSLCNFSF